MIYGFAKCETLFSVIYQPYLLESCMALCDERPLTFGYDSL